MLLEEHMYFYEGPHVCRLAPVEDVIVEYIDSGYFVNFRRKFRKLMLVNEDIPMARSVLKSSNLIRLEQIRQLKWYYYMIHPFSKWWVYWTTFQIFVHISCFIIIPIDISTGARFVPSIKFSKIVIDVLFASDVVICFFTGFYNPSNNYIYLDWKSIMRRYMRGTFVPDIISCVNMDFFLRFDYCDEEKDCMWWQFKLIGYTKIFRIFTLSNYLDGICEWLELSRCKFQLFKMSLLTCICLIMFSSVYLLIMDAEGDTWLKEEVEIGMYPLIAVITKVLFLFLLYGHGRTVHVTIICRYIEMGTMTAGVIFHVFVLTQIMQLVLKNKSSWNKYYQMINQLREYIKFKNLSEPLAKRIIDYYNFKYQNSYYREDYIMETISEQLRQAIVMHRCQKLLEEVKIFSDVPPVVLVRIVSSMSAVHYLENDIIVRAGDLGDCMYFILTGTVAIYTKNGKEVCHLTDGGNFGEIAIALVNEKRVANVVAVEACECYKLTRNAFRKAIEPYPDLYRRIQNLAMLRLRSTQSMLKEVDQDNDVSDVDV